MNLFDKHDFVIVRETFIATREYLVLRLAGETDEDCIDKAAKCTKECAEIPNSLAEGDTQEWDTIELRQADRDCLMTKRAAREIFPPDELALPTTEKKKRGRKPRAVAQTVSADVVSQLLNLET